MSAKYDTEKYLDHLHFYGRMVPRNLHFGQQKTFLSIIFVLFCGQVYVVFVLNVSIVSCIFICLYFDIFLAYNVVYSMHQPKEYFIMPVFVHCRHLRVACRINVPFVLINQRSDGFLSCKSSRFLFVQYYCLLTFSGFYMCRRCMNQICILFLFAFADGIFGRTSILSVCKQIYCFTFS